MRFFAICFLLGWLLSACATQTTAPTVTVTPPPPQAPTPTSTLTLTPTPAPALNLDAFAATLKVFPLLPGAQWSYRDTEYDTVPGAPTQIVQAVFEITESVTEVKIIGADLLAHLQRKAALVSADPGWSGLGRGSTAPDGEWWYIVHAGQVYSIPALPADPQAIDFAALTLAYQLPLADGARWCPNSETKGNLDPAAPTAQPCLNDIGARIVTNAAPFQSAAGSFPSCYLLTDVYNTGNILQTFCDGVGIVSRKFDHAGTRFGFSWELKSFTSPIATPAPTPAAQLTDEQVLAKALLQTGQKTYCSWQILGQSGDTVGAWVLCERQVFPNSAASVPVVIHLDSAGHYGQVEIPRDGNDYGADIRRLFPLDIQTKILGNNYDLKSLEQGIARRKTGEFTVPYIIPSIDFVPRDYCSWVNEPVPDVPGAGASALSGWSKVTLPEAGFMLDVPQYWRVVQFRQSSQVCGKIDGEPHFLKLQTPDGTYQLTIGFRRPDQLVYITPTFTWFGDFVDAGQFSFFGKEIPAARRVYEGRDMAVFYSGASEFAVGGNVFTLLLAINNDPKNNESIPRDVEDQAKQILASFQAYPPAAPNPTATPAAQLTDEQVLAKALLQTDQKTYCSWMILGYGTQEIYAWADCELQVLPNSATSAPVVIHLDQAGHYSYVVLPRDGALYGPDVRQLFPPNVQSDIFNPNLSKQSLDWGIALRKAGVINVPYVTLAYPMDIPGCTWKNEPLSNLPASTAPGLSGWKSVVQAATGFSLSIPADWSAGQSGWDCGAGLAAPDYLTLLPPDTHYQLIIGFRRPDQPFYITRTGTPAGDFVDAGQVSFFGNNIPASRLVYQGRDMAVFYNGSSEFAAGGNLFTLSLDITSDPKNNESIPQDVEDQARQILASFQAYPPAAPSPTATLSAAVQQPWRD